MIWGTTLFRVIHDRICWVSCSSSTRPAATLTALQNLDPTTLQTVYETPDMQDLWNTLAYLNSKGVGGEQIMINFMGWTPVWMGGSGQYGAVSKIKGSNNDDFAVMIASLVYYARTVKGLDFSLVAPMNEPDLNGLEGPQVTNTTQYASILAAIVTNLRNMGVYDVNVVGPDTAGDPTAYIASMLAKSTVAGSVNHFTYHSYSGSPIPYHDYSPRDSWVTEISKWCSGCDNNQPIGESEWSFGRDTADILLGDIGNGYAAVLNWEGFDTFYYHHNSYSAWGSVGCLQNGGGCTTSDTYPRTYFIRDRAYPQGTLGLAIRPGMVRRGLTTSLSNVQALAFYNQTSGAFSIVGHNKGSSAVTIEGQLQNIPTSISALLNYQTNSSVNIQRMTDVPVSGGLFTTTIPGDTFFALTSTGTTPPLNQVPSITLTSPVDGAIFPPGATVVLNAVASDSDGTITQVEFYKGGTLLGTSTTAPYSYQWVSPSPGAYDLWARAYDNQGASADSLVAHITVSKNRGKNGQN